MTDDLKFKSPFTCIISGPSGSGKSSFCIRFLQNLDSLCTERHFAGGIIWCYSERAVVPSSRQLGKNVRFNEGVPKTFGDAQGQRQCFVILEDLLNEVRPVHERQSSPEYQRDIDHAESLPSGAVL